MAAIWEWNVKSTPEAKSTSERNTLSIFHVLKTGMILRFRLLCGAESQRLTAEHRVDDLFQTPR